LVVFTNIGVVLNIPILRQILGFPFLMVLPGLLILIILKLDKLGLAERIALIIGMSIAFLLIFGWALNEILLQFNYTKPLSSGVLMLAVDLVFVILIACAYLRNKQVFYSFQLTLDMNDTSKWFVLLSSALPLVSILAINLINTSNNNSLLLVLLFAIPFVVIAFSMFNRKISPNTYALSLIMIAAALLFMYWLRSPHILGNDVHEEYYFFQLTLNNGHWAVFENNTLDSCLSISILPTIFQSVVNFVGQEYLFKGIYALISIFIPLVVFIVSKKYVGEKFGFLAAFYFVSQSSFLMAPGNARTNLAIFFFGLCVMVLFLNSITNLNRKVLFLIFLVATVVSHYSTTYIFFFLLLATLILSLIWKKYCLSRSITWSSVAFLAVLGFLWYAQLVQTPYGLAIHFLEHALVSLQNFFVAETRSTDVGYLFGYGIKQASILIRIQSFTIWLSFLLIGIGIIGTLIKHKDMLHTSNHASSIRSFLHSKFETEYFFLSISGAIILLLALVIPYVSVGYDLIRVYEQTAVFLSVFLVGGGLIISRLIRVNGHIILLIILIPYFLFTTFAVYEVFGIHETYILSSKAPGADYAVVTNQETFAAQWLKKNMDGTSIIHTTDGSGADKLMSQGLISDELIDYVNFYNRSDTTGYIYLTTNNVVNHKLEINQESYDISKFADVLSERDKIYSNGGSEVLK
jgi:uncharacterized membrane protein